jgi:hypothetical protein
MSADLTVPVVAYIWRNHVGPEWKSLRWTRPTQWDHVEGVDTVVLQRDHEAALASLQRDAARYRWLRDQSTSAPEPLREVCAVMFRAPFTDDPDVTLFEEDLDAALDAIDAASQTP